MKSFLVWLILINLFHLIYPLGSCREGYVSPDAKCGNNDGIWHAVQASFKQVPKSINSKICTTSVSLLKTEDGKEVCQFESFDNKRLREEAVKLRKEHCLPMICKNDEVSVQIGVGFILCQAGYPHIAIQHFARLIQEHKDPPCAGLYYSRAQVYQRLGPTMAAEALSDYTDALEHARPEELLQIYESRAKLFSAINQKDLALRDYGEAISILPSAQLYYYRGTDLFLMKRYAEARLDLDKSISLRPEDCNVLFCQATCLYEMNALKDAISVYKRILALEGNMLKLNSLIGIGKAKREMGDLRSSLSYLERALELNPNSSEALKLKTKILQEHGYHLYALETMNRLMALQPNNSAYKRYKVLILIDRASFFEAIKLITQLSVDSMAVKVDGYVYYPKIFYLREWCRFIHSHLDRPINEFSPTKGLGVEFVQRWIGDRDFHIRNYTEQPGLNPRIGDLRVPTWDEVPRTKQTLLCEAYKIGSNILNRGARFGTANSVNRRLLIASGLAALEIGQTVSEYWNQPASHKNKDKNMKWRRPFEIATKWLRFVDLSTPVFWKNLATTSSGDKQHRNHTHPYQLTLISENRTTYRHEPFLPHLHRIYVENLHKLGADLRKAKVNATNAMESFFSIFNTYSYCKNGDGCSSVEDRQTTAVNKLKSKKSKGEKTLRGATLRMEVNRERKLNLTVEVNHDAASVRNYHAELEYLWRKVEEERKRMQETPAMAASVVNQADPIINLIITMVFYFVNLMPLSSQTTEVGYSTMIGLFLAIFRETSGIFPKGKQLLLESILHSDPDKFRAMVRGWINIKSSRGVQSLMLDGNARVSDLFSTYRDIIEALLIDVEIYCK